MYIVFGIHRINVMSEWSNKPKIVILQRRTADTRSLGKLLWRKFHRSPLSNFRYSCLIMSFGLVLVQYSWATDWPTFRGSDRTGIAPDTDLLEVWPEDGPKLVWRSKGAGRGYALSLIHI